jgi:hypothetical protein
MLMVTVVFLLQNFHELDEGYYHADGQQRGDKLQHALPGSSHGICGLSLGFLWIPYSFQWSG